MKKFIFGMISAAMVLTAAAETITFNTQNDWRKHKSLKFVDGNIMEFTGNRADICSKAFAIDPNKKYTFTAEIRTKPGTVAGTCYIGNWSIAAGGKLMLPDHILAVSKSDCQLLEAVAAGSDKVVISKPACIKNDKVGNNLNIAFNSKADMSDLPNFDYVAIAKGEVAGDKVVLTLKKKLTKNYAAGTPVRFQRSHMGMYRGLSNKRPSEEWTKITWTVSGKAQIATNPDHKWWYGAEKGAIRIIANYAHQKNAVLQVRNVTLTIE